MLPNDYWEHDDTSRDQKFYTAFCILASACSDYAVGAELRLHKNRRKLNWACTVLYYSLVHAARLICFVETGDFPTGHKDLGELFRLGSRTVRSSWVRKSLQPLETRVEPITDFRLTSLPHYDLEHWGQILTQARKLRDDANYEGLLISHEFSHTKVTECFAELATTLKKASEEQLPKAVKAFRTFVDSSPRKDCWYAFLNWKRGHSSVWSVSEPLGEGLFYLEASLKHRIGSTGAVKKALSWLKVLRCEPDSDMDRAEGVHGNIVMSAFGVKNRLMRDFERDIQELDQRTHRRQS